MATTSQNSLTVKAREPSSITGTEIDALLIEASDFSAALHGKD